MHTSLQYMTCIGGAAEKVTGTEINQGNINAENYIFNRHGLYIYIDNMPRCKSSPCSVTNILKTGFDGSMFHSVNQQNK